MNNTIKFLHVPNLFSSCFLPLTLITSRISFHPLTLHYFSRSKIVPLSLFHFNSRSFFFSHQSLEQTMENVPFHDEGNGALLLPLQLHLREGEREYHHQISITVTIRQIITIITMRENRITLMPRSPGSMNGFLVIN